MACTHEYVIVKSDYIMKCMTNLRQSCLPAFYALAIPVACFIPNVFLVVIHWYSIRVRE